jgi:hypothetical protein
MMPVTELVENFDPYWKIKQRDDEQKLGVETSDLLN